MADETTLPLRATARTLVLWTVAILGWGVALPWVAQRYVWTAVRVELVNRTGATALEDVIVETPEGPLSVGTLAPGAHALITLHARRRGLHFVLHQSSGAWSREVNLSACCRAKVQVELSAADAPKIAMTEEPAAWAAWAQ